MSENLIQNSFTAGELAPSIFARTDLQKYHAGAATMRNFFVDYRSGASTRSGTAFVVQAFNSGAVVRLIPFQTSVLVPYILEFGDGYVRPISNGGSVLESPFNITTANNAAPVVITVPGNNFVSGDWIFITGIKGETQLNGRFYKVIVSGSIVTLEDVNGDLIDGTNYGVYISGGTASRVYKFASPYAAADLALLKFVQVTNTMYLTHPNYPPKILTFTAPTNWSFASVVFGSTISAPTSLTANIGGSGAVDYAFLVTAVDSQGQESVVSNIATLTGAPDISNVAGTIFLAWTAAAGAVAYNVYKAEPSYNGPVPVGAAFGFIGSTVGVAFNDSNIVPDFTQTPPIVQNPFSGNNPGVVCFFQQRIYYAASTQFPQTFWASQPGSYNNFNISNPTQASDAITDTLVSVQVNAIKSMLPMPGGLIFLTAKGAWQLSSGQGIAATSAVTGINATAAPQAYNGASDVPPIVANYDILYVQAKGSIVRDLSYNIYAAIYTGTDISVLSNHLFFQHQISQWAYSEEPFKVIWAIRDDGICLSLTFLKEQEIYGWARHDTLGLFQSVASVTEGQTDAVYFVVKRFIGGRWVQMIERMANRTFTYGAEDAWSVDCGITSSLTFPNATLTASGNTGTVTFTTDAAAFTSTGMVLRVGGGIATITQVISAQNAIGKVIKDIDDTLPNDSNNTPVPAPSGTWSLTAPATVFSGLDYLEGQTVSILADGGVIAPQTVVNGTITLQQPATKVTVGLGFQAQLQTMYLDVGGQADTVQGKRKKIGALTIRCNETRGLKAGRTFKTLVPIKQLSPLVPLGSPSPLINADIRVIIDPLWDVPGQICIQQDDPLPATVLGVIPEIVIGDTK